MNEGKYVMDAVVSSRAHGVITWRASVPCAVDDVASTGALWGE